MARPMTDPTEHDRLAQGLILTREEHALLIRFATEGFGGVNALYHRHRTTAQRNRVTLAWSRLIRGKMVDYVQGRLSLSAAGYAQLENPLIVDDETDPSQ